MQETYQDFETNYKNIYPYELKVSYDKELDKIVLSGHLIDTHITFDETIVPVVSDKIMIKDLFIETSK